MDLADPDFKPISYQVIEARVTVEGAATQPVPDIKANGSDGPINVLPYAPVRITVSLNAGERAGQIMGWYVAAFYPFRVVFVCVSHRVDKRNQP